MKKLLLTFIVFAGCFLGASRAHAAVAFDAVGTQKDVTGTSDTITTLTVGSGANRALVVQACFNESAGAATSIVMTWDFGGSAQNVPLIIFKSNSTVKQGCGLWGLVNPVSGAKTLKATWATGTEINWNAASWTGVDQTGGATSFPNSASSTATNATHTLTVTSQNGNAVMGAVAGGTTFGINSINQTQTFKISGLGSIESAGNRLNATTTNNTLSATFGGSEAHVFVGTDIQQFTAPSSSFAPVPALLVKFGQILQVLTGQILIIQ